MSSQKKHEFMGKLDKCYNVVLQSSAKGISAVDIAKRLSVHRTTVHSYLNTLELMGKVYSEHGLWYAKTEKQEIEPLEKEIVIELPIPRDVWMELSLLEVESKRLEKGQLVQSAELIRTFLEKFRETRIIKVRGRNVDSLDLERLQGLILQAYERSSKAKFGNLFKRLKGVKDGSRL